MNNIKNVNNIMPNNILNRNPRNNKKFSECPKSQKNTKTISTKKTMAKTVSSININKKINIQNKKSKNSELNINQNKNKNNIPPSIILNYSKSLYFYNKIQFVNRFLNMKINLESNKEKRVNEDEHNRKNSRNQSLDRHNSTSNKKIHNNILFKKNEKKAFVLNVKEIKNDYKEKVIKIQSFIRSFIIRNKINPKIKYMNKISKNFEHFKLLLSKKYKKLFFLQLKKNYFDNTIKNDFNLRLRGKKIDSNKNDSLIKNKSKLIDIDNYNKIAIKIINNNNLYNKLEISSNNDIIIKSEENNNKKNEFLLDELNNNFQKAINENKNLENKLSKTADDYNKLKEKIKGFEKNETKYNDVIEENEKLKSDIIKQKEEMLKEIELIKNNYNKLLEEQKQNFLAENEKVEKEDRKSGKKEKIDENDDIIVIKKENEIKQKESKEKLEEIQEKIEENSEENIDEKEEQKEEKIKVEIKEKVYNEEEEKGEKEEKKVKRVLFNLNINKSYQKEENEIHPLKKKRSSLKNRYNYKIINKNNINDNMNNDLNNDSSNYMTNNTNNNKMTNLNNYSSNIINNNSSNSNNNIDNTIMEPIFSFNSEESDELNNSLDEELEKKEKEKIKLKKLKDLVRNKIDEKKSFLHKYFVRLYYNGLFLKMIGKLPKKTQTVYNRKTNSSMCLPKTTKILPKILNQSQINEDKEKEKNKTENKSDSNIENINNNNLINNTINNINPINQETNLNDNNIKKEESDANNKVKRVEKARGLRRLLSRKVKEKKEVLREYFYKFYRAGIISKMRSVRRLTKSYIQKNNPGNKLINIENFIKKEDKSLNLFYKKSKSFMIEKEKENEELKLKKKEILSKIFFKIDRNNVKVIRNFFEKYYLRAKLESFGTDILPKKKKKKKKKKKTVNKKENEQINNNKEFEENEKEKLNI